MAPAPRSRRACGSAAPARVPEWLAAAPDMPRLLHDYLRQATHGGIGCVIRIWQPAPTRAPAAVAVPAGRLPLSAVLLYALDAPRRALAGRFAWLAASGMPPSQESSTGSARQPPPLERPFRDPGQRCRHSGASPCREPRHANPGNSACPHPRFRPPAALASRRADGDLTTRTGDSSTAADDLVPFDLGGDQVDVAADGVLGDDGSLFLCRNGEGHANGIKRMGVTKLKRRASDTAASAGRWPRCWTNNAGVMHAPRASRVETPRCTSADSAVDATNRDFALCVLHQAGVPAVPVDQFACVTASFDLGNRSARTLPSMVVQPTARSFSPVPRR